MLCWGFADLVSPQTLPYSLSGTAGVALSIRAPSSLRSECFISSCSGYNLLALKSAQEKVTRNVRFDFMASLILETSDFENEFMFVLKAGHLLCSIFLYGLPNPLLMSYTALDRSLPRVTCYLYLTQQKRKHQTSVVELMREGGRNIPSRNKVRHITAQ